MNSCAYHALMFLAVVLAAAVSLGVVLFLVEKFNALRNFVEQYKAPSIFIPAITAMVLAFIFTSRVVPKHIKVVSCDTGERIEKVALNTNMTCTVKNS